MRHETKNFPEKHDISMHILVNLVVLHLISVKLTMHMTSMNMKALAPFLLLAFYQLSPTALAFVPSPLQVQSRAFCSRPKAGISNTQQRCGFPPPHLLSDSCQWQSSSCRNSNNVVSFKTIPSPLFGRSRDNVDFRKSASLLVAWAIHFLAQLKHRTNIAFRWLKRRAIIGLFFLVMTWSLASGAAFAVTGGRSGGSFKRAPMRSSYSRPMPPRSNYNHYRPSGPSRVIMRPPTTRLYYRNTPQVLVAPGLTTGPQFYPYGPPVYRRGISLSEVALVTGAGLFIAHKVSNQLQQDRGQTNSALGPGFTMAKLTVSLNVPNRDAPDSILKTLQRISSTARTNTRAGVQQLISSGTYGTR